MHFSQTQIECMYEAANVINARSLDVIGQRYGADSPDPQEYHNLEHTGRFVIPNTMAIASLAESRGKIDEYQVPLLWIAAGGHDRFYDAFDKSKNEEISAQETVEEMRRFTCFEESHLGEVEKYIMATKCKLFFPRIVQSVDPSDYAQGIIADADLSNFGMPPDVFIPNAMAYLEELKRTDKQRLMQYLLGEVTLLKNHVWHTEEAGELFPNIQENIQAIQSLQTLHAAQ